MDHKYLLMQDFDIPLFPATSSLIRSTVMSDREYFIKRAASEREAAMNSASIESFRAHMGLVREYEWRAGTKPYLDEPSLPCLSKVK
jgi:hypothetical protein